MAQRGGPARRPGAAAVGVVDNGKILSRSCVVVAKHAPDLRTVVDVMPYIAQTGCRWRYLTASFGPRTRLWPQFRRWPRNGTWTQALAVLHAAALEADGRAQETPG